MLLNRISPDLLRERAKRARAATGLRRWVAEPGVDEWHGTFPSEDAAAAWAAIDKLAHDLVAAGTCTNIEQARGKALTDLVTGNATIDVQVVLTVPAATGSAQPRRRRRRTSTGLTSPLASHVATSTSPAPEPWTIDRTPPPRLHGGAAPRPAAPRQASAIAGPTSVRPLPRLVGRATTTTSSRCRGPGPPSRCSCAAAGCATTWRRAPPLTRGRAKRTRPSFVPCDPLTGARLDPGDHLTTDAYRPSDQLAALVRARDGRCRFPGCSIAARFCDLDHVRPWPTGPTAARNLLTLCRRHHRIKQRPGWRLRLAPDGTTTWTDPTGRNAPPHP